MTNSCQHSALRELVGFEGRETGINGQINRLKTQNKFSTLRSSPLIRRRMSESKETKQPEFDFSGSIKVLNRVRPPNSREEEVFSFSHSSNRSREISIMLAWVYGGAGEFASQCDCSFQPFTNLTLSSFVAVFLFLSFFLYFSSLVFFLSFFFLFF